MGPYLIARMWFKSLPTTFTLVSLAAVRWAAKKAPDTGAKTERASSRKGGQRLVYGAWLERHSTAVPLPSTAQPCPVVGDCACACVRERERDRASKRERERGEWVIWKYNVEKNKLTFGAKITVPDAWGQPPPTSIIHTHVLSFSLFCFSLLVCVRVCVCV